MDDKDAVLGNLVQAVGMLEKEESVSHLIPEIRTNVAYALPLAVTPDEVAAIKGRITVVDGKPRACGYPGLGASNHLARLIISLMKTDPSKRAAMDIKYSKGLQKLLSDYCEIKGLLMVIIDRSKEPAEVKQSENQSMQWLAEQMVSLSYGRVPDVACSFGGEGKEPVTVLIGKTATEVVKMAVDISQIKDVAKVEKPITETTNEPVTPEATTQEKTLQSNDLFDDLQSLDNSISKKPEEKTDSSDDWTL
ncbi:MAG: hypothetical protein J7L23_02925 [Candidatus Diapherotrites archaeon]|nr:hypothetical protein [Candidatus Diapherotrites archaeon]